MANKPQIDTYLIMDDIIEKLSLLDYENAFCKGWKHQRISRVYFAHPPLDEEEKDRIHMLYDIVRKLPDGAQVELSTDETGGRLVLISGKSSFALQTLPREDFPAMAQDEMPVAFALLGGDLRRLIEKTRFAISQEETRYYLNGIYLHALEDDGKALLRAVATDGHRLARVQMAQPVGAADMPAIIVPRKTVGEVQKLLEI